MMMYDCAIKEVRTKLEVLNTEMSLRYRETRSNTSTAGIKKPVSIVRKLQRKGLPLPVETLESNAINDIAGIRVICAFIDDIYSIANMLIRQDDITLIDKKDYIKNPKANGYRSLSPDCGSACLLLRSDEKSARGSIEIRTIAMDFWASLEHQLKYKKQVDNETEIVEELRQCAETIAATDERMLKIRNQINGKDSGTLQPESDPIPLLEKFSLSTNG